MFVVDYDPVAGIVRCTTGGFYNIEDSTEHLKLLRGSLDRCHREFRCVGLLVNAVGATVQSPEVVAEAKARPRYFSTSDRMAIIVPFALSRMQGARFFTSPQEKIFAAEDEGMAWLKAELACERQSPGIARTG